MVSHSIVALQVIIFTNTLAQWVHKLGFKLRPARGPYVKLFMAGKRQVTPSEVISKPNANH